MWRAAGLLHGEGSRWRRLPKSWSTEDIGREGEGFIE
jgi:hypothetical protein